MRILDADLRLDRFFANLGQARHRLLVLDYDGTLAPFHVERDLSHPYPGVGERLQRILDAGATRMVVLSGRPAAEVEKLLGGSQAQRPPAPEIWGCHGCERKLPGLPVERAELPPGVRRTLADAAVVAARLGWDERLERKSASLAAHTRGLEPDLAAQRHEELAAAWREIAPRGGLRLQPFDGGLELKAPQADKGAALSALLEETPADCVIAYLGDDLTDEDAFAAVPTTGLSVLVRSELRPTRAGLWLTPPDEVESFLDSWHRATTAATARRPAPLDGVEAQR